MWRPEGSPDRHIIVGVSDTSGVLVSPRGDPQPPREVVDALKARHPRYKIEWVKGAWGMSGFYLKEEWRLDDPRRDEIRRGQRDPESAFDVVTKFPDGCPPSSMVAWIENNLGFVVDPVKAAAERVERAMKELQAAQEANQVSVLETGIDRLTREDNHDREVRAGLATAHPMVPGADFTMPTPVDREPKRLI